jgi:hypothetical protein
VKHLTAVGALSLLLCSSGTQAEAQEAASSFEQLAALVQPGDTVTVVEATGAETKGQIWNLFRDKLIVGTAAGPRELGERDVAVIRQRRGDSLKNGAIIGAAAGAAYFATMATLLSRIEEGDVIVSTAVAGGLMCTGIGAAAGIGIDALISRQRVIYKKSAGATRVSVSPLFGRTRRGAAVSVTF